MFCLDTNVVIFAMNGRRPRISNRLETELAAGTPLALPMIVRYELEYGCSKSERSAHSRALLDVFLAAGIAQLPFDLEDAREAGIVRAQLEARGTPIGPYDTLIAAQARNRGATLVTLNLREFERVPKLRLADWSA